MSNHTSQCIEIQLTQGKTCIIDIIDSDLANFKWYAVKDKKQYYVAMSKTINGKKRQIRIHQIILERMIERSLTDNEFADHIDLNALNNTRGNIRLSDRFQNSSNRSKFNKGSSKYKGVSWDKRSRKWRSSIQSKRVQIYLGLYNTEEQAHEAYKKAAIKYHGEFARFE